MFDNTPWTTEVFKEKLLGMKSFYHIHHPFNQKMNRGELSPLQVRAWVINRFYYQINIPLKDAAVLANCPCRKTRREWIRRILEQDGTSDHEGGIDAWLDLGLACGIPHEIMWSAKQVLPGVQFSVDAYRNFARQSTWQDAVAASLTELFASEIHQQRIVHWPDNYPWIKQEGLRYFRNRLKEVPRDVNFALDLTLKNFKTREQQERAMEILRFKLNVLWSMLDALYMAYVVDLPPPTLELNKHEYPYLA